MKPLKSKDSNSQFKGITNVSYLHLIIRMVAVWYGGNSCGHIEKNFSLCRVQLLLKRVTVCLLPKLDGKGVLVKVSGWQHSRVILR